MKTDTNEANGVLRWLEIAWTVIVFLFLLGLLVIIDFGYVPIALAVWSTQ